MRPRQSMRPHPQTPGAGRAVGCVRRFSRETVRPIPRTRSCSTWGALAHARAGASARAHALLDRAQAPRGEAADRLGRNPELARPPVRRTKSIVRPTRRTQRRSPSARARNIWRPTRCGRDPYPGINAATLSLIARRPLGGAALAQRDRRNASPSGTLDAPAGTMRPWARRCSSSGKFDRAARSYASAYAQIARATRAAWRRCGGRCACSRAPFRKRPTRCGNCPPPTWSRSPAT